MKPLWKARSAHEHLQICYGTPPKKVEMNFWQSWNSGRGMRITLNDERVLSVKGENGSRYYWRNGWKKMDALEESAWRLRLRGIGIKHVEYL